MKYLIRLSLVLALSAFLYVWHSMYLSWQSQTAIEQFLKTAEKLPMLDVENIQLEGRFFKKHLSLTLRFFDKRFMLTGELAHGLRFENVQRQNRWFSIRRTLLQITTDDPQRDPVFIQGFWDWQGNPYLSGRSGYVGSDLPWLTDFEWIQPGDWVHQHINLAQVIFPLPDISAEQAFLSNKVDFQDKTTLYTDSILSMHRMNWLGQAVYEVLLHNAAFTTEQGITGRLALELDLQRGKPGQLSVVSNYLGFNPDIVPLLLFSPLPKQLPEFPESLFWSVPIIWQDALQGLVGEMDRFQLDTQFGSLALRGHFRFLPAIDIERPLTQSLELDIQLELSEPLLRFFIERTTRKEVLLGYSDYDPTEPDYIELLQRETVDEKAAEITQRRLAFFVTHGYLKQFEHRYRTRISLNQGQLALNSKDVNLIAVFKRLTPETDTP